VYQQTMRVSKKQVVSNAVCEQAEWDALEAAEPGVRTLVRGRIGTEEEAERLARGTSGDGYRRNTVKKAVA
jgi:hypothetical protein